MMRTLLASVLINALVGTLFGWSLLLDPLQRALQESLGALSFVPALAIGGFTVGILLHDASKKDRWRFCFVA